MAGFREDTQQKVIEDGIKEDIRIALEKRRFRAALILIYAGIDSMAYLDLPAGEEDVHGADFIRWADRYIRFPCVQQVAGKELYGARCGLLHTSGVESKISRTGKGRMIGYGDKAVPEVRCDPKIDPTFVMVSIDGLKEAFFRGIYEFLIAAYLDPARRPIVEARLEKMVQEFPFSSR